MDPLSIVASSVAISHALSRSLEVIRNIRKAGPELDALYNEISDLALVLGELELLLERRAASADPVHPNATLSKAVALSKARLDAVTLHVKQWKDILCDPLRSSDYQWIKVLRVSSRAKRFKQELRDARQHLSSIFSILSMSSATRIEVDLKQVLLLSSPTSSAQVFQGDVADSSHPSPEVPPAAGNDPNNALNAVGVDEQAVSIETEHDVGSVRAFHANGPVLFSSSQMTCISAVGVRVAQFSRMPCNPWCSCKCHQEHQLKTPSLLNNLMGSLFIGYSGLPYLTSQCDQTSCHLKAQPFTYVTYIFPKWFLTRALSLVLATTPLAGPSISLKFQRTVPGNADIFTFAKLGNAEKMKELFEKGLASPFDVQYDSGVTALHYAINFKHVQVCKLLLQCNADPFFEDRSGIAAADNAWGKILSKKVSGPTETALRTMFSQTECIERREFTVLHKIVVGLVHKDLGAELAASTADINVSDTNGRTPLSLAAQRSDAAAISTLLSYGADVDIRSSCGNSALHHASIAADACCMDPLLAYGADVNSETAWNQTPLHYVAAYVDDPERVRILLRRGANMEMKDLDGMTALDWASMSGNAAVAKELLAKGADFFHKDHRGNNAMANAVTSNRHVILADLLAAHNSSGTPQRLDASTRSNIIFAAANSGDLRTFELLSRSNIDFSTVNLDDPGRLSSITSAFNSRGDVSSALCREFENILGTSVVDIDADIPLDDDQSDEDEDQTWEDAVELLP